MPKVNRPFIEKLFICCMVLLLLFIFQGCAKPYFSEYHGRSFEAILLAQAVNPDAPVDKSPVNGCPGIVAEKIYEEYLTTFGGESFAELLGEMLLGREE